MAGYTPLKITGMETGLVQDRQEFILPEDAYPILENVFLFREQLRRRQGLQLLGRLKRFYDSLNPIYGVPGLLNMSPTGVANIKDSFLFGSTASIVPGTAILTDTTTAIVYTDQGDGTFLPSGSINYATGLVIVLAAANHQMSVVVTYYPGLPVMGLRLREDSSINDEQTVAFDTTYAYKYTGTSTGWVEFLPGTTWTGTDSDFFWSTNYWYGIDASGASFKIFWVTNNKDPIRYTNGQVGTNWVDFSPVTNAGGGKLSKCLCMLPFRGRMVVFNTLEIGSEGGTFPNRIRWSEIGNPFDVVSPPGNTIVTNAVADAWLDDVRGKGGFLDIPTNEDIISVGFVRDNLVIYCERSTWQLRYTGRSIAPFQIEKVNSELGAESTFSAVQFDTSLVGIGDKGIVECDSYKSNRIDVKIPDLVFQFNNKNNGIKRVHGVRDFVQRLAYWIYPFSDNNGIFPDRRLVYNYENDSWAIFTDSLTALGTFQPPDTRTWANTIKPWQECNFNWKNQPSLIPAVIAGNQQGYTMYITGNTGSGQTTNDQSLFIKNITGFGVLPTDAPVVINSPNHNFTLGDYKIIKITGIIGDFSDMNDGIYEVNVTSADTFYLDVYDPLTKKFSKPYLHATGTYIGLGEIAVRDNFRIVSKKFNYMDQGKQFQLGWIDLLLNKTTAGAISLNVYTDYEDGQASNVSPLNVSDDSFFNSVIPTNVEPGEVSGGNKNWKRVFCATNSNFITLEYTLNNEQMQNQCQESDVQIDAQVIWNRVGGRLGITM